jgi:hypothetical protein
MYKKLPPSKWINLQAFLPVRSKHLSYL